MISELNSVTVHILKNCHYKGFKGVSIKCKVSSLRKAASIVVLYCIMWICINASLNMADTRKTTLILYNLSFPVAPALSVPLPSEVQYREGESLNMSCLTSGHPPPVVKWEKELGKYLTRSLNVMLRGKSLVCELEGYHFL